MSKYTVHPVAELFRQIEGAEFDALVADIKANGQQEPIWLQGNVILDGRNRLRACESLGIAPEYKEVKPGTDAVKFITSKNVHRRHLTTKERARIAAQLANLSHGSNQRVRKEEGSNDPSSGTSIDEAAKAMSVSPKSVKRAKKEMRDEEAAKRGEKPVKKEEQKQHKLGWAQVVLSAVNIAGLSSDGLMRRGRSHGLRDKIEEEFGRPIPAKILPGSAEAEELIEATRVAYLKAKPQDTEAVDSLVTEASEAKSQLPKTAQEKLDAAIRAAKRVLELEFEERVRERVTQLLEDTVLPRYRTEHDRFVKFNAAYKGVLTRDEYKRLLNFLHPDRHPEDRQAKASALFDVIKSKEEVLCGPEEKPLSGLIPATAAELLARRRNGGAAKK